MTVGMGTSMRYTHVSVSTTTIVEGGKEGREKDAGGHFSALQSIIVCNNEIEVGMHYCCYWTM